MLLITCLQVNQYENSQHIDGYLNYMSSKLERTVA
jgi:hypothetical protein